MTKEEVIAVFKEKSYLLEMGAGKISFQLKTDINIIREARAIVRKRIKESVNACNTKEIAFKSDKQKILFLDIETAPLRAFV